MSFVGFQINPIDVNFHLQKSLEIFDNKNEGTSLHDSKIANWQFTT